MSGNDEKRPLPVIFGCAATRLSVTERALFKDARPLGFILLKRNCENPLQLRRLINELCEIVGHKNPLIAIDQEGGRVSRLQPPSWPKYPSARAFGQIYERDPEWGREALRLYARTTAHELARLGFTVNCAPVMDLFNPTGTPAIGDRAYSAQPMAVAELARLVGESFMAHGILPVMKHLPGHGRLKVDPHHELPIIDTSRAELEQQDFVPFELLKDMPLAMNSHAVFSAIDPAQPASLSSIINNDIIRAALGFDGLLISDDLTMKALKGGAADLAKRALAAGNDIIIHSTGDTSEMATIADAAPPMSDIAWARWTHARAMVAPPNPAYDAAEDLARLDVLLGGFAFQTDPGEAPI